MNPRRLLTETNRCNHDQEGDIVVTDDAYIIKRYEDSGVIVELVQDTDGFASDPQQNDNAGTMLFWGINNQLGDESLLYQPDWEVECGACEGSGEAGEADCSMCEGRGIVPASIEEYIKYEYDAAFVVKLRFEDRRYSGRLHVWTEDEDTNGVLFFTRAEIDEEWSGRVKKGDDSTGWPGVSEYAEARIKEYDQWLAGEVFGIVVRERTDEPDPEQDGHGGILNSVWGFIGDPLSKDWDWIVHEAHTLAEESAVELMDEAAERFEWACRDVVTV